MAALYRSGMLSRLTQLISEDCWKLYDMTGQLAPPSQRRCCLCAGHPSCARSLWSRRQLTVRCWRIKQQC